MQTWPTDYRKTTPYYFTSRRIKKPISSLINNLYVRLKIGLFFILLSYLSFSNGYSQNINYISDVDFKLVNDKLEITYNIINYRFNDRFNIKPNIFVVSGKQFDAKTFTGDLKNVSGGPGKKIIWHIDQDNAVLDNDIYVILTGEKLARVKPAKTKEYKSVSRTACVMESILFPGFGTTRLSRKNGHLVKGFLGYGTAVTAIVLYNSAMNSYDDYKSATISSERDSYYDKVTKNNLYAKIFAAGAATIWTIEFISVLSIKSTSNVSAMSNSRISFGCDFIDSTPVLAFKINF